MNNKKINIINKLCNEASKSQLDHQLSAILIQGNKIMSYPYCNTLRNMCRGACIGSLHAEARVIINYFGNSIYYNKIKGWKFISNKKNQKLDLFVIRINKSGDLCNARPCFNCLDIMKLVGIRRVYYSINNKQIICEYVKDMISIQISAVSKHIEKINGNLMVDNKINYYEDLLKKKFPNKIKYNNLYNFINYNLYNVLPNCDIEIINNIIIIKNNNKIIIKSIII